MMRKQLIGWVTFGVLAWAGAVGAQQGIPLPRSPGAATPPVYRPAPAPVRPAPAPVPTAAPPAVPVYPPAVYSPPTVRPAVTPALLAVDEEEEGIYWPWGEQWPGLALGPKFGTTGVGLDVVFGINPHFNLRGGFNYGVVSFDARLSDIDYTFDVDMISLPLLLDIHPFGGHFHLTAGLYLQPGSQADIQATPKRNVQIGEHTYPPNVVGTLYGKIEVAESVAPYLGIGFGNVVHPDQLLTFHLDIGVVIQSYDVSLTSDGAGMTTPVDTFRKDLEKEAAAMQKDLDQFRIYPVLTLGLAWHF